MKGNKKSFLVIIILAISIIFSKGKMVFADTVEGYEVDIPLFLIYTVEDLYQIPEISSTTRNYKLMRDLDLENVPRKPISLKSDGYSFDGNGHTIEGLNIVSDDNAGLFGFVSNSSIENLTLKHVTVTSNNGSAGAIAGAAGYVSFTNCYVEDAAIKGADAGGLVGFSQQCIINNCYVERGDITSTRFSAGGVAGTFESEYKGLYKMNQSYFTGKVTQTSETGYAGGLVGKSDRTSFNQCYAISEIKSENQVGGLIGFSADPHYNEVLLTNCYSISTIETKDPQGNSGIINKGELRNCYSATSINQAESEGLYFEGFDCSSFYDSTLFSTGISDLQGRTTDQMYQKSTYPWDFENVWYIEEGEDYPRLRFTKNIPVINSTNLTLKLGEKVDYSLKGGSWENSDMTWDSEDPGIVSVDSNGVIEAVNTGTATITAKAPDNSYIEKIKVLVKSKDQRRITLEISVGETYMLTTKKGDNFTGRWTVNDPSVATVAENGQVTAVSPGIAKITARNSDGGMLGQIFIKVK